MILERISIELTNRCQKGCWFCYNRSGPAGDERWTLEELLGLIEDCAAHGTKAVSLGGGEPLESPLLLPLLGALQGRLFRSLTTNGLLLTRERVKKLARAAPDKVHVSIHFPENKREVERVIDQVHQLQESGIHSGVNLLVAASQLPAATAAATALRKAGLRSDQIVFLPMRGQDTPSPQQVAAVAGNQPFQSMTCLGACGKSPRFCSVAWDGSVAWCSYTTSRRLLPEMTHRGLAAALTQLPLVFCGGTSS